MLMAGRPKSKKSVSHYTQDNKYDETVSLKYSTDYKFDIGEQAIYIGGLYENYKNQICTILKRNNKMHRIDYSIQFSDNTIINCVLERVLIKVEDVNINNVIESDNANET